MSNEEKAFWRFVIYFILFLFIFIYFYL